MAYKAKITCDKCGKDCSDYKYERFHLLDTGFLSMNSTKDYYLCYNCCKLYNDTIKQWIEVK